MYAGHDIVSVNGTFLEVPNITYIYTEVKLCVSFDSIASIDGTVVFAHRTDKPNELLAYNLNTTNCTTAPPAGNYIVGVFIQNGNDFLEEPAISPSIFIHTVLKGEY